MLRIKQILVSIMYGYETSQNSCVKDLFKTGALGKWLDHYDLINGWPIDDFIIWWPYWEVVVTKTNRQAKIHSIYNLINLKNKRDFKKNKDKTKQKATNLAEALILDFQLLELRENEF